MFISNKFKTTISCSCKTCKRYSKYKQFAYRCSKRKFRNNIKVQLHNLVDFDDYINDVISAGYTD